MSKKFNLFISALSVSSLPFIVLSCNKNESKEESPKEESSKEESKALVDPGTTEPSTQPSQPAQPTIQPETEKSVNQPTEENLNSMQVNFTLKEEFADEKIHYLNLSNPLTYLDYSLNKEKFDISIDGKPSLNNETKSINFNYKIVKKIDNTFSDIKSFDFHDPIFFEKYYLNKIRIGLWNVLNFSLTNTNRNWVALKTKAISALINYLQIDVQGLVEVDNEEAVIELVRQLNELNENAKWDYLISKDDEGGINVRNQNRGQHEKVAILFKRTKVRPQKFKNNKVGTSYNNENYEQKWSNFNIGYVRPPYGAKFESNGINVEDFTVVFNHFDSPDNNTKFGEGQRENSVKLENARLKQGGQELDEAYNLVNLMTWYDDLDEDNDDLIFSGDTNIKTGNEEVAFDSIKKKGFKSLIPDIPENNTSLNTNWGYANAYDKIFYSGNKRTENANFFPLYNYFKEIAKPIIENINTFEEWVELAKSVNKNYKSESSYIRSLISDHSPVYFDFVY
ncbi:endonuclease/exonuclease/phosphatase family protein [Mycoplasmopsis gallinarum]|uniref:endonuclease/exonuclease/phosphatase family protein n=1 Tax=Mycoplasmopsis gallinarum TaxID=29557 RepID=UPI000485A484|nr:endonuclease/exonuclease/phosphatase family protein [Mycoplasmopsis gallinarum]